ncbi:FAD-dependent 5-carboxymethylaminomethyl-2-thiouridine(34) oxidoreductase MnmC [Kingella sp. (in: b-proteobacteria)]|uniref:FAD-dependent 5-carboxymethylaminomethyl-2-thiouridine(34) oxidoreductase MnmC n=1 Tax=Kingella sp. (in: b-proteobacteria) TaxID=2020713 RepID=UPI0026DC4653|nr:FAD-dependent 5-carboxymethylaminomethyl-2-thiouridine(34) oxidoreductase MnmC [Kingella sp. (in: b-proteobacteria)]MDO4658272.1 FAD-dependent 5-carboxymethylaminomethyl-2-thiouridine(34) oxidoreductase MnmC [Kingella sp. (in: b-proteobacteria)]
MTRIHAWANIPSLAHIQAHLAQHPDSQHLIFCLTDNHVIPPWQPENEQQHALAQAWQETTRCLVYDAVNYIRQWQPETDLWLLPPHAASHLHEHFPQPENIIWHTVPIAQQPAQPLKAWQQPPQRQPYPFVQISDLGIKGDAAAQRARLKTQSPPHVLIIGAGIAGAATAHECATRGARVTVLEAHAPAQAASGNQQGLLYAKISPHATAQTELLLAGYGYTRRLLQRLFPQQQNWGASGVLHLNHNESETQRNTQLAQNPHYQHLYRPVSPAQASQIAGIPIAQNGLYWQQGAWLNPPALIHALLRHPNITLHRHTPAHSIHHSGEQWRVHTPNGIFSGSHIVFCTGADNAHTPIIQHYPFQIIRGQTSIAPATQGSLKLKTALSAASYISPAWQGEHCYGATFAPNNPSRQWQHADEAANRQALAQLSPYLAQQFADYYAAQPIGQPENEFEPIPNQPTHSSSLKPNAANPNKTHPKGHTATRCDCHDHLPAVGAISDPAALRTTYAAYALDKNYRIATPCPYLPNAYTNTAHGSRGLATAPICAAEIAAQICHTPRPLSERLRQALNPNRLIIRQIIRSKT